MDLKIIYRYYIITMKPEHLDIEKATLKNNNYRKVIYTVPGKNQVVLMSLNVGEDIPMEIHPTISQFIRVESGRGYAMIDGKKYTLKNGYVVTVPPGLKHYIKNTSKTDKLKLYTVYSPDNHPPKHVDKRQPKGKDHDDL